MPHPTPTVALLLADWPPLTDEQLARIATAAASGGGER